VRRAAAAALLVLAGVPCGAAGETFDVSAYERRPFEWGGYLEARPERQWLDRDTTGYRLQYPGGSRTSADRLATAAQLSALARSGAVTARFTGLASWIDEPRGADGELRTDEAYAAWQVDERITLEAGKRALRWGKGYAWSPVAFLERPKDPADPEQAREGFAMAVATMVRSFDGPLRTLALTAAMVPTAAGLNPDFGGPGDTGHANVAVKLYGLLYDTDVDLLWAAPGSRGPRVGVDVSRNLAPNLAIHGEWARLTDATRAVLGPDQRLRTETRTHDSLLLGLRYLAPTDTTVIAEIYRNGGGYGRDELGAFHDLVRASVGDPARAGLAAQAAARGYARPDAGRRLAYLRVSQKEPFGLLHVTPAVTLIANTGDRSGSLIPELTYTGVGNLELRARLVMNRGDARSEFGERAARTRLELRARLHF